MFNGLPLPTTDDMLRLARDNAELHAALSLHLNGGCSWDDALMFAVAALVHTNRELSRILTDVLSRGIAPPATAAQIRAAVQAARGEDS